MNPLAILSTTLFVASIFILLGLLLLFLPVRLYFSYGETIALRLNVLFFSFPLYPKKKKWKMKEHLPEYQKKKQKKKKTKKEHLHKTEQAPQEKISTEQKIKDLYTFTVRLLDRVIFPLLDRLKHSLTVRISKLEVIIGGDDAAQSALLYGLAVNSGYALLAFVENHAKLKKSKNATVFVSCPFTERKSKIHCELEFGMHLFGALFLVLPALYTYLTEFTNSNPPLNYQNERNSIHEQTK